MDDKLPHAKKSLGQHWLTDSATLSYIVDVAEIEPGDAVLEIGPGTGTLTEILLGAGADVTAVEFDRALFDLLQKRAAKLDKEDREQLRLVNEDILQFDFRQMPADFKVVANIPYYLTSNLIRTLSELSNQPQKVVLLIQKEVAQRVAARAGGMSLLSVSAQFYWQVSLGQEVPARLFTPPPKVDSQVLILTRREQPLFPDIDQKQFFRIVKAGFSNRRKTLLNSLSGGLHTSKEDVKEILNRAGVKESARPQELSLDEWKSLYDAVLLVKEG